MSKLETNTIDTVSGTTNLVIGSTNTSTITMPNGKLTGHNYPAFEAYLSSTQSISDATHTKIQFDAKFFDTDNCYSTSTYKFTPTVAGKYYIYLKAEIDFASNQHGNQSQARIFKNGTVYSLTVMQATSNPIGRFVTVFNHAVLSLNGTSDYVEGYGYGDDTSGTPAITGSSGIYRSTFGAYRIGA